MDRGGVFVFAVALELVVGEPWASQGLGHWQPATGAYAGRRTDNAPGQHFSTSPALALNAFRYFVLYSVCLSAKLLPLFRMVLKLCDFIFEVLYAHSKSTEGWEF